MCKFFNPTLCSVACILFGFTLPIVGESLPSIVVKLRDRAQSVVVVLLIQLTRVFSFQAELGLANSRVGTLDIEGAVVAGGLVGDPGPLEKVLGLDGVLDERTLRRAIFAGPRLIDVSHLCLIIVIILL